MMFLKNILKYDNFIFQKAHLKPNSSYKRVHGPSVNPKFL